MVPVRDRGHSPLLVVAVLMAKRVQLTEKPKAKKKGLKSSKPKAKKKVTPPKPREVPLSEIAFEQVIDTLTRTAPEEVTAWAAPTISRNTTTNEESIAWLGSPRRVPRQHPMAQSNFRLMAMQVLMLMKDANIGMKRVEILDPPTCKEHS